MYTEKELQVTKIFLSPIKKKIIEMSPNYGYHMRAQLLRDLVRTTGRSKVEVIAEMRRLDFEPFRIPFGRNRGEIAFRRVRKDHQPICNTDLEMIVEEILIDLGYKELRDYQKQYHTLGKILDFAFPTIKLAIEPGARYFHGNRLHSIDPEKDTLLRGEGWEILWYDEEDLKDEESVKEEICMTIQDLGYIP
jgi:very-short-patch-repair endonuclease